MTYWGEPPELEPEDWPEDHWPEGRDTGEKWHEHYCRACGSEWGCADPPGVCLGAWAQEECSYCGREDEREESDREREGRF